MFIASIWLERDAYPIELPGLFIKQVLPVKDIRGRQRQEIFQFYMSGENDSSTIKLLVFSCKTRGIPQQMFTVVNNSLALSSCTFINSYCIFTPSLGPQIHWQYLSH